MNLLTYAEPSYPRAIYHRMAKAFSRFLSDAAYAATQFGEFL